MAKKKKNIIKKFENPANEREYLLAALKLKQREKESLVKNFLGFLVKLLTESTRNQHEKFLKYGK